MNLAWLKATAVALSILISPQVQAVSILERAGNNFRTAANNQEYVLNKSNVNASQFGLLRTYNFNAKVETQPLIVEKGAGDDDLVIITTMKNEVIGINARTNATVYSEKLGPEASSADMDLWKHTPTWGISATPIIDPNTDTLYVAAWMLKHANNNHFRDYWVFALNPRTGKRKADPVRIWGQSQEGHGCWFNDADAVYVENNQTKQYVYPKLRAGLALTANHGLVLAFSSNAEKLLGGRKNPHGMVVAYDTRGLLGQTGFSNRPGIFCATSFNGWGAGIWHAGGAPVTEGNKIYVATSNGTSNNGDLDLSESMIKLRFTPSVNGNRPVLQKMDFYKAFMDERTSGSGCLWPDNSSEVSCGRAAVNKAGADWDFGAAGPMLIPGSNLLLQGTKDGLLYSLDKNNLGKHERFKHLLHQPPLVASYYGGNKAENWRRAQYLNLSLPCPPPGHPEHDWFQPCGNPQNNKMHHIHALAFAQRDALGGIVYVWGENANLKTYNYASRDSTYPSFRAEGLDVASGNMASPGGMPGGLMMISSKPSSKNNFPYSVDFNSAVLWAIYPRAGDVNKGFAEGQLVAYDATTILPNNKMRRLFRTGSDHHGGLGTMSKMIPPVVANGRVYVMIYRVGNVDHCSVPGNQLKVCSQLKIYGLK